MENTETLDLLFRKAVSAIDDGDQSLLEHILISHPGLAGERLCSTGAWLRDKVGRALDGFFQHPYLLWFVAEDPVRNNKLPLNIAEIARTIILSAKRQEVNSLQEQLDYALRLVSWSWVARKCNVQIDLIDALVDAGAYSDGVTDDALVNGNFAAAERLIERGAKLTLGTALCLGRWEDVSNLVMTASDSDKQFGLTLSALNGKAEALARLIGSGVNLNTPSSNLYSHGTALHHAVSSGSLDAVKILVEAGAALDTRDTVYGATPLGWAEYEKHPEISVYLREKGAQQ